MGELLAPVRPGLIVVDGEEELADMVTATFPETPVQRCLFHLARGVTRVARYRDRADKDLVDQLRTSLDNLLAAAYHHRDQHAALAAYDQLADRLAAAGATRAATHLRRARPEVFTFLTHPDAGRLVFGDKGRPELGTGVLERVMRELNRRTDVGVRWTIHGVRAVLMIKLQHKYRHGPWSPDKATTQQPKVRFSLAA
jgi:transposase-like protein